MPNLGLQGIGSLSLSADAALNLHIISHSFIPPLSGLEPVAKRSSNSVTVPHHTVYMGCSAYLEDPEEPLAGLFQPEFHERLLWYLASLAPLPDPTQARQATPEKCSPEATPKAPSL
jgi:hypothetical protein